MYELPIPAALKTFAKSALPDLLWRRLKELQRDWAFASPGPYSFDEVAIHRQIDAAGGLTTFFVDIGAQDGVLGSQTLGLAKQGWAGVCYEGDLELVGAMERRYAPLRSVAIRSGWVTPNNVVALLQRDQVPMDFGFLSLDIDSYDYHVLVAVLEHFVPQVICVEINEMIPPPILFSVDFATNAAWAGDRFQGFSIQAAKALCNRFGYRIGELHYNNLLLVKSDGAGLPVTDAAIAETFSSGYRDRPDRDHLFPWNVQYASLLHAPVDQVLRELKSMFAEHLDRCELTIEPDNA